MNETIVQRLHRTNDFLEKCNIITATISGDTLALYEKIWDTLCKIYETTEDDPTITIELFSDINSCTNSEFRKGYFTSDYTIYIKTDKSTGIKKISTDYDNKIIGFDIREMKFPPDKLVELLNKINGDYRFLAERRICEDSRKLIVLSKSNLIKLLGDDQQYGLHFQFLDRQEEKGTEDLVVNISRSDFKKLLDVIKLKREQQ